MQTSSKIMLGAVIGFMLLCLGGGLFFVSQVGAVVNDAETSARRFGDEVTETVLNSYQLDDLIEFTTIKYGEKLLSPSRRDEAQEHLDKQGQMLGRFGLGKGEITKLTPGNKDSNQPTTAIYKSEPACEQGPAYVTIKLELVEQKWRVADFKLETFPDSEP